MSARAFGWIAVLLVLSLSMASAENRCKLLMSSPLAVKMDGLQPVVSARINGADARFVIDTGSFFDFLSPAAATQFKLPLTFAPPGYYVTGVGGSSISPQVATANSFEIAGIPVPKAIFLVGINDFGGGVSGILGQNLFRIADVDYDFANGVVRFVKPQHCGGHVLAYWAPGKAIGVTDLHWTSTDQTDLIVKASVNGRAIHVVFDSGSSRTILSLDAAKRIGITPDSPGVVPAGGSIRGIGDKEVNVWVAPLARFEIGGEAIEHTHVLIGDIGLQDADMLLGADFFLAHHIYVAYSQDKLYFTYNGGPVFDLNGHQPPMQAQTPLPSNPPDAAGFMRRGMAETSRGELARAIADLTQACKLDAGDADCRYQRGLAYSRSRNPKLALADFNDALKLAPGDYDAHLARAELQLPQLHAGVAGDLDAVDHLTAPEADLRMELATLYDAIGKYAAAARQLDLWIQYHPEDVRLSDALGSRCWERAAADLDLDRALSDCNEAVRAQLAATHSAFWRLTHRSAPSPGWLLRNRSLVYLRLGDLDKAIADDDAALQQVGPGEAGERADLLYLRALVELRKGMKSQGQADLAAARHLQVGIDDDEPYAGMGLKP